MLLVSYCVRLLGEIDHSTLQLALVLDFVLHLLRVVQVNILRALLHLLLHERLRPG